MLKLKVCITKPLGTNCRRLIFIAGELAEKFAGRLEVEIDERPANREEEGPPRPYYQIGDDIIGKDVAPARLEEIVREMLARQGY